MADLVQRGDKLIVRLDRDCWELGVDRSDGRKELYASRSRLTVRPVSSLRWEAFDAASLAGELEIGCVYIGSRHWEEIDASELIISSPHYGWRLILEIDDEFPEIRLDDLETPHGFDRAKPL
ncbi:hypothetical protein [Paludisphaera sp.]|uniref:hypothetical protein n=1 Tax=Paludisphaera sp. TaxID=2017432 RepID=UPI00301DC785